MIPSNRRSHDSIDDSPRPNDGATLEHSDVTTPQVKRGLKQISSSGCYSGSLTMRSV